MTCDHAERPYPQESGFVRPVRRDLQRHIAWDIGAAGVAVKLADALDAFAILAVFPVGDRLLTDNLEFRSRLSA